jgi:hypothetical protein
MNITLLCVFAPSLYGVRRQSVATTALLSARGCCYIRKGFARAKAVSPLRSATALQNTPRRKIHLAVTRCGSLFLA